MSLRILIVCYSMSGHTRELAAEIGRALGAEVEEIREPRPRRGLSGVWRAMVDVLTHREPPIEPARLDPTGYDLLVLGGPIWAGHIASPVRSYARRYASRAAHVAFFCTEGGRGADQAFSELEQLCARTPVATLTVDGRHLAAERHRDALRQFVRRLKPAAMEPGE